ncbi:MAG TPA: lysine--tRNA ligase, partial [Actinomycetota bacterium]|nr:lysine--tRNA ligase [Actinomycetota bacterium]
MTDPGDGRPPSASDDARGREAEVLRARRVSRDRLGDRAFAFSLEDALGETEARPTAAVREAHLDLGPDTETDDRATLAGRVVMKRDIGKLVFLVLRDRAGDLQLVCDERTESASFELLADVDLGDIVGATGRVGTTRRGELSLFVERLAMLTKALRPLPEKWHGLKDPDLQLRQRYLHLATDLEYRRVVTARAETFKTFRRVLDERAFVEVETPVLQLTSGGAIARPFVTHHRALDIDMSMRIALELFLKRALVGGLERVYEIGRIFRNEGLDRDHNPEFTMLEAYQAYGDFETMMELTQTLIREAALAVRGSLRFAYQGRDVDLESEWPRRGMLDLVSEAADEEITLERSDLVDVAVRHGIEAQPGWGPGKLVYELYEKLVEEDLWGPVFVCDVPREVSPLARPHRSVPGVVEHFDLVLCGTELVPAYSELSDPDEQRRSFEIQAAARARGEDETHPMDEDFLTALEHGMPPAGGMGLGVDRLVMILADAPNLREVILFPHHRPA